MNVGQIITKAGYLTGFGHVKSMGIDLDSRTARVEFFESAQAASAVEGLTDYELGPSAVLSARFDLRAVETGPATLRSTKVKLSWYAPSIIAWAHYSTVTKARAEAKRLDGMIFDERKIGTSFQTPNFRQTRSFSVAIVGLPVKRMTGRSSWSAENLKAFTRSDSVSIGRPTYDQVRAVDGVRVLLRSSGELESFDVMPTNGKKITAWAQFTDADAATAAVKDLHNTSPSCLGGKIRLWMEHIHSFKYSLPRQQFLALESELERVRATAEAGSQLRYYDKDERGLPVDPVCVRLYGSDPKVLGRAKIDLEHAIQGAKLDGADGTAVWEEFFLTPPGETFLRTVYEDTQTYVRCDTRTRSIRLHGSEKGSLRARTMLEARLDELQAHRHVISLERNALRTLLAGGYRALQEQCGDVKLDLNIVSRSISLHGSEEDVAMARRTLQRLATRVPAGLPGQDESCCPVCFCEVSEPFILPCGHIYDTECIGHLIKSAITSDFAPVQCVKDLGDGKTCSTDIQTPVIRDFLTGDEETQLLEASMRAYMHRRPHEFYYCPTPDCPTVYRSSRAGTVVRCPNCMERFCPSCHVEYHEGLSCEEYKDGMSLNSTLFQRWKDENGVKSCPKCRADIQKNGGCNHITCARCKTHICWACMKTFEDGGSDGGVYPHMSKVHGGLGYY